MIALRVARAVRGWTASEVARIAGFHVGFIRDIETGSRRPSKDSMEILRVVYGDDLVKAEEHYGPVQTRERGAPKKSLAVS